jgi:hypothetical protein
MHLQSPIVVNVTLLPESIHEEIDARARGPDHLGQDLMTDDGNLNDRPAIAIQVGQPEQHARQPLFRGRSQQVRHVIPVVLDAGEQVGDQGIRGLGLLANQLEHFFFLDGTDGTAGQGHSRGHAERIASEAKFAKEIMDAEDGGNGGWLMFRAGGEANAALLDVEKRVGRLTLFINILFVPIVRDFAAQAGPGVETAQWRSMLLGAFHSSLSFPPKSPAI